MIIFMCMIILVPLIIAVTAIVNSDANNIKLTSAAAASFNVYYLRKVYIFYNYCLY